MIKHEDRLAHGWFLKQSKLRKAWLVDPFTLHKENGELVAHRTNKRMLLLTESSYIFENLKLSELRYLTHEEFAAVVSSDLAGDLPDDFTVSKVRCFDVRFGTSDHEKCMTVIGRYNETMMNVRRVMLSHLDGVDPEPEGESTSVAALLGSMCHLASSQEKVDAMHEKTGGFLPTVISSRLTMTMDDYSNPHAEAPTDESGVEAAPLLPSVICSRLTMTMDDYPDVSEPLT